MEKEICISVNDLAKRMHISRSAAYNLSNSEAFYPAFRLGKRLLINVAKLERWLEEQGAD